MNKNQNPIVYLLKEDLGLFLSISFGIFLFVLFFQPFPLESLDFNNRLLFIAGLGAIVFIMMALTRIGYRWFIQKYSPNSQETILALYLCGFILLALSSVAFVFYLRYVGLASISFYIVFKVILICLAPPVVLRLYDRLNELRKQNEMLVSEREKIQKQVEKYEEDSLNQTIGFIAESNAENLNLLISDVVLLKSADNYVEIVFKEEGQFKKKLIRNTLRNIELQTKQFSVFVRCHRICIINKHYIEKLTSSLNNHWLILKDYPEQIPVSRQYLLKIKEIL